MILEVFRYLKRRAGVRVLRMHEPQSRGADHAPFDGRPKIAVIIPTRDKYNLLRACVDSVLTGTDYSNYELLIINNDSRDAQTLVYLKQLEDSNIKILDYPKPFNYSKICNFAAENTDAEFLCFLNNDTEVLTPQWLSCLIDHATKPDVAVVGAQLLYPNGLIQHAGIALGHTGAAGHVFMGVAPKHENGEDVLNDCFEVSAVTFACALVSKKTFLLLKGLDTRYRVGLNDVDFCIRSKNLGLKNIICKCATLTHHESMSRKSIKSFSGSVTAAKEVLRFIKTHGEKLRSDYFFKP